MSLTVPIHVLIEPALIRDPARLEQLLVKTRDYAPVLEELGQPLEQEISEWFTSQGEGTWAELAPSTIKDRFRRGFGANNPLIRTGKLLDALTVRGAPGHKFLVTENSLTVGAYGDAVVYMNRLNKGDPSAHLPGRLLINVGAGFIERAIDAILDWLGAGPGVTVYADTPLMQA